LHASPLLKFWLAVVVVALAIHLGGFPLLDPDEGRNAEVAREMAETNDYVMPRYNALPYLDKPVVYFASAAAVMEVLGPTEFAARLPAYLFTLATAALLFFYARRMWGDESGYIAAIVFLSMPLVVAFSRTVIFDSALAFFCTAALVAFARAVDERNARWSIVAWLAMGFAMITKGPVTFVLVLVPALIYAWRRKAVAKLFSIVGLILFAAVIAPWVWGVSQVVPEFLEYVLVTETAARMATDELKRTGPPWYFVPYLLGGALPWIFVALFTWRKIDRRELLFWLLAIAIPLLFFSISQSKRPQYILPLMAPLALVVARIWPEARTRAATAVVLGFAVLFLAATPFLGRTKMKPELMEVAPSTAIAFGCAFAIGGALAAFGRRRRELVLIGLTLPVIALPLLANPLLRALGERRSTQSFVEELAPHVDAETEIVGVEAFTGSMAFYLRRPVTVVSEDASELTSNYLVRRYEKFSTNPASTLKPLAHFSRSLGSPLPRVYILRNNDLQRRALLESRGWQMVADGAHHVAYAYNAAR
jgi:4-amino-4-deoxy-L-arabinose transferase-like glycosyltransferase